MKEDQQPTSSSESEETLTNRQGHPVTDNQNMRTVGNRGPTTLENYDFLEKISHFDRERIPERVVHARGAGAHGYFEAYGTFGDEPISTYTRAKLFQEKGKRPCLRSILFCYSRRTFTRNFTRSAGICDQILYRRRQLGSRWEQPQNFLYSRCFEIP